MDHYVNGGLIATVLCFGSVLLFFFHRFAFAAGLSAVTVVALLAYRFLVMPPWRGD